MDFAEIITTMNDALGTNLESLVEVLMFDIDGSETVFQTAGNKLQMDSADFLRCTHICLESIKMFGR